MDSERKDIIDTVQVALRIRPLVESEIVRGCAECIDVVPGEPQVQVKDLAFTFNYVFPPHIGQQEFYDTSVKSLIKKLFDGYNVTILAYGQTGSGKTHSMGTNYNGSEGDGTNLGKSMILASLHTNTRVIPQAVSDIFSFVAEQQQEFNFKVSVSFMELYQEQCYDLLSEKPRSHSVVEIREDHRGVVLPGLTERDVKSGAETMRCLMQGSEGRAVGATAMNAFSSRSHAIFTVYITKESRTDKNLVTTSKFHMVDLAGSERSKKTGATGDRFKEGVKINQGLLALGNVISALGDGSNRGYICYRESKLTRLLQDSLGGNSLTMMVACVSPADYNLEETVSTLRYADRARRIRNKPVVNQDAKAAEIARLNTLVNDLKLQLMGKGISITPGGNSSPELQVELERERKKYNELLTKHKIITELLHNALTENTNLCEKALLAEASKEKIERKLNELTEKCNETIGQLNVTFDKAESMPTGIKENVMGNLEELKCQIEELNNVQAKANAQMMDMEIKESQNSMEMVNGVGHDGDGDGEGDGERDATFEADAILKQGEHAMDQVALTKELQDLNQAMAYKATVIQQITKSTRELLLSNVVLKENEDKIAALEKEKNELQQQLKHTQHRSKNDKNVEDTRGKIQVLEREIENLRKKCQQQANLIKMKEKNEQRITALNKEIQNIKTAKVTLIKRMRAESERFRKLKQEQDRDLCQMRAADRRRQNAMARMETMHAKQQNVLKRKMEEAVAVNKRLKEALERQKSAQIKRSKSNNKGDHVQHWVEQELEIQLSTVEAQVTLDQLMEYRGLVCRQLEELRADKDNLQLNRDRIEELQNDIALRNAQISDMQQKILAADQDNKSRSRWENVQSMVEAKTALKYIFELLVETKRDMKLQSSEGLEGQYNELQATYDRLTAELDRRQMDYERQLAQMQVQHETEVRNLIRLGRGAAGSNDEAQSLDRMHNEQLEKLEEENKRLHEEIERLESIQSKARTPPKNGKPKGKKEKKAPSALLVHHLSEDDEDSSHTDDDKDPEWRQTPVYKQQKALRSRLKMLNSTTNAHNNTGISNESNSAPPSSNASVASSGVKRDSDGQVRCTCRTGCINKLCGCRKAGSSCGAACKCPNAQCKNRQGHNSNNVSDKENKINVMNQTVDIVKSESPSDSEDISPNKNETQLSKKKRYFYYPPTEDNKTDRGSHKSDGLRELAPGIVNQLANSPDIF